MQNSFDPINLRYASEHLEWVISNFKTKEIKKKNNKTFFSKLISLLKKIF